MNKDRYKKIISIICESKGITEEGLLDILKDKNLRYIFLLILKNNDCMYYDELQKLFNIKTKKSISNGYKRAKESLFVNKEFRELYFSYETHVNREIEKLLEKNM